MEQTTQQHEVENLMIAANCNTVLNAIAYSKSLNLIACAASNTVLILDPQHYNESVPKVLFTLRGHSGRVNSVCWLTTSILATVSVDQSLIIWSYQENTDARLYTNWTIQRMFENAHSSTINQLATYSLLNDSDGNLGNNYTTDSNELYLFTMCSTGTLKLWQGSTINNISFRQELLFGKNLQEAIGVTAVGQKHLILLVGGYDSNIHVYLVPRIQHQLAALSVDTEPKIFKYKFSLLGHANSIRGFSFTDLLGKNIRYLASASQDSYIRIWKIQPLENVSEDLGGHDDLKQYESKTSYVLQDSLEEKVYNITLESVLSQHTEAVSSVFWQYKSQVDINRVEIDSTINITDYYLLSSSFDFTICIWKADPLTEQWMVDSNLGAMTGNKHAYFGAIFLENDHKILAYTFNGAMNQWKKKVESDLINWSPQLTIKGHFGEVCDLDWVQYDRSLVTTSQDQTTRLISQYGIDKGWFEFGRPQVHGYDINTIATLKVNGQKANLPSRILSGGDEKVLRLFEAPFSFVKTFNQLNPDAKTLELKYNENKSNEEVEKLISSEAQKQPLGLMNKPVVFLANDKMRVDDEAEGGAGIDFDPKKILSNVKGASDELLEELSEPPLEDILMSKTLWPELQKLYGHAFEVYCVATSHKGDCAASACKAKDKKYADIIIWDMRKSQTTVPSCRLQAHSLTVIQLEFSKCDQYLLSCSRDRSWALFVKEDADSLKYTLIKRFKEAHTRIIWGISWSHDDYLFVTASREKSRSVKIWKGIGNTEMGDLHSQIEEGNPSATAVRFFPNFLSKSSNYGLLVGLESGDIIVWIHNKENNNWTLTLTFPLYLSHCASVRRIKFNCGYSYDNKNSEGTNKNYMLATCGNDHCVRLFKLIINQ